MLSISFNLRGVSIHESDKREKKREKRGDT